MPRFRLGLPLVVALAASGGGIAKADPGPTHLSLEQALRAFAERGFDLLLTDAALKDAEGDEAAASAVPNPAVSFGYSRAFDYDEHGTATSPCPGCSANGYTVGLSDKTSISDSLFGKRSLRARAARSALQAAKMDKADAVRVFGFDVKREYVHLAYAQLSLRFAVEVRDAATKVVELNKLRVGKVIDDGEFARIETAMLNAEQAVDEAGSLVTTTQADLAYLLGEKGSVPSLVADEEAISFRVPGALDSADVDSLVRKAVRNRPDVRAAGLRFEEADAALALAKRKRIPELELSVQYMQMGTGQVAIQPPTLTGAVSLPLPVFYQNQGEVRKAEARSFETDILKKRVLGRVLNEVTAAFFEFTTRRRLVERAERSLLERSKRARDITATQYQAGTVPLMDLLDAQRSFIATRRQYLEDLEQYWASVFRLERGGRGGVARMKPEFIHRLCVVVGLFGCGRHHDVARADEPPAGEVWLTQEQIAAAKISVTPAEEHVVDDVIVTSGAFAFDDQRVGHVVSPVNGRVVRVNVELGQQVKRGEALAVIDSPDVGIASSELGKANADLLATRHEYERQKELFDQHAASQRDYEQAEDAFRKSQAELDRARQKAKLLQTGAREEVTQGYVLRAPLDGEVLTRNVTPGGEVQGQYGGGSAAELFTVGELGRVWLFSDVYEMDMARVKNGAKVTVRVVAYPDETFDGKVEWVSGVLDPVSRTAKVRCTFDNKERRLKPNMYATVNISVDASKALAIPRAAMLRLGDTTVVFVERGQIRPGKLRFERAVVVVDDQGGPWLKVRHGIEGGDRVVTAGAILLTGMM